MITIRKESFKSSRFSSNVWDKPSESRVFTKFFSQKGHYQKAR